VLARRLAEGFVTWLDGYGERSQDPYDFWAWGPGRRAKRLYHRHRVRGAAAALPFVALDVAAPASRRLVRRPRRYPIADAHYARAFFAWAALTGDAAGVARGEHFLRELERSRCPGEDDLCWGYPFDWEARAETIPAGTPLMTTVPYGYDAFAAGHAATGRPEHLAAMASVARFAAGRIPVTDDGPGRAAAAYTPRHRSRVVNASAYRARLLAAAGRRFGRDDWARAAAANLAFVLDRQRADGSWAYAPDDGEHFVDNFHTCLVLKNLAGTWRLTGRDDVLAAVLRGYRFYRARLLDAGGQPVPFAVKPRATPVRRDLYDYAEGLNLAVLLDDVEPSARGVAAGLVAGLARDMRLADGHFATRRLVAGRTTVPYHRWGQAQAFGALVACAGART
jgi:hypothetical protein